MGRAKDLKGVTLLELLAAMTILIIVGLFATPIIFSAYRSFEVSNAQMRLQNHLHIAMREIVSYIEDAMPLPVADDIGDRPFEITSSGAEIKVYNFVWEPPDGSVPQTIAFQNSLNYTTTTMTYSDGQITAVRKGGGLPDLTRPLGVPEQRQAGAPEPVNFTDVKFEEGLNKNDVIVTLEAEVKTKYGTAEKANLTVTITARGRRAGD